MKYQTLLLSGCLVCRMAAAEDSGTVHQFGETVAPGQGVSLTVARQDAARFRSEYAREFEDADGALAAFSLQFGGDDVIDFATDREDPSHSDIVALCGEQRVNAFKMGSLRSGDSKTYIFGKPGAFQGKDKLWHSISTGGSPPLVVFFRLPAACVPAQVRLSAAFEAGEVGKGTKYRLLFADPPSAKK